MYSFYIRKISLPKWIKNKLSNNPTALLLRQTSRQQWRLITLNLICNLVNALSAGAALGVVFLAVEVLSQPINTQLDWSQNQILSMLQSLFGGLNEISNINLIMGLIGAAFILQMIQSFSQYIGLLSAGYFEARCRSLITSRIHRQVLNFSFSCASGFKVGDLTNYSREGPEAIHTQIDNGSKILTAGFLLCTYLIILIRISPWLFLGALSIGGIIAAIQKKLLPKISIGARTVVNSWAVINSQITEHFQGLRLLHSTGQLDNAQARIEHSMDELEKKLRSQVRKKSLVKPFSSLLPILAITIISIFALLSIGSRSTAMLPELVTFVLTLTRFNNKLSDIGRLTNTLADNKGRMDLLNQILSNGDKELRKHGGIAFLSLQRSIQFEKVSLQYLPDMRHSLSEVSFTLQKGQTVALVGPSGAGKSSIADILTGLYKNSLGKVFIDDIPMEQLDLPTWQQKLGVVSQDTFLFNATIYENITFCTPGKSRKDIEAICEAAQAAEFINALPQGYETIVGERGYRLSGGQRQRISLARAILRDPELLILDEATSALDSRSEYLVQEAIEQFERDHTVLVIAHRLSSIVNADRILVLDAGRVVQEGNHNELTETRGLYRQLWLQQTR